MDAGSDSQKSSGKLLLIALEQSPVGRVNATHSDMKTVFTNLLCLLLGGCLTLYGPYGMVERGNSGFTMEICADGAVTTISVDAQGNPVEPAQTCPDCLTCCHATAAPTPSNCSAVPSFALLDIEALTPMIQDPVLNTRYTFPVPRGPPAVHSDMAFLPGSRGAAPHIVRQNPRSDGRSLNKDATA